MGSERVLQMINVQREGLELFKKKNTDYCEAYANYGIVGFLVRMGDKIIRLQSISAKNITLINNELLRDTLIDLHNYSAMAIILLDEDKKKNENKSILNNNYFELLKKNTSNNDTRFESNIFNFRG